MRAHKGIPIANVYYMLAYAFEFADDAFLSKVGSEEFDNQQELLASLLDAGVSRQLKRGLFREYINEVETTVSPRGKIAMPQTIQAKVARKQEVVCEYDDLSENNIYNQVIKTTLLVLIRSSELKQTIKNSLRKKLLFFGSIDAIPPDSISWEHLRFTRHNQSYRFLVSICQLILTGMLMRDGEEGDVLAPDISETQMERLYERFILRYYQKHWSDLHPSASQIPWAIDEGETTMLPIMQSDIILKNEHSMLIIDAKYYGNALQERYDSEKVRSGHLYQIFAYVKNAVIANPEKQVSGMLLYARTIRENQPDEHYRISGNEIFVETLDLGCGFVEIRKQLDDIAKLLISDFVSTTE